MFDRRQRSQTLEKQAFSSIYINVLMQRFIAFEGFPYLTVTVLLHLV